MDYVIPAGSPRFLTVEDDELYYLNRDIKWTVNGFMEGGKRCSPIVINEMLKKFRYKVAFVRMTNTEILSIKAEEEEVQDADEEEEEVQDADEEEEEVQDTEEDEEEEVYDEEDDAEGMRWEGSPGENPTIYEVDHQENSCHLCGALFTRIDNLKRHIIGCKDRQ